MMVALALSTLGGGCPAAEPPVPPPAPSASAVPAAPVAVRRAQLQGLQGDVKVKRAAGDEWLPAQEGMALFENDKVRTVAGAGAQIVFTQGSVVSLGEDALISIAETRPRAGQQRTDLTVLKGRVDAELADPTHQSLSVTTPAATVRAGREIVFQ
jgi:hypothetical protein